MLGRDDLDKLTGKKRGKAADELQDLNSSIQSLSPEGVKEHDEASAASELEDVRQSRWSFRLLKRKDIIEERVASEKSQDSGTKSKVAALMNLHPSKYQQGVGPLLDVTNKNARFTYIFGLKEDEIGQEFANWTSSIFHGVLVEDIREKDPIKHRISVKRILPNTRDNDTIIEVNKVERQIAIWEYLNHDNIVRLAGIFMQARYTGSSGVYIASHYAIYGNVQTFLQRDGQRTKWASLLVKEVVNGMEYLHSGETEYEKEEPLDHRTKTKYRVFHGDVKPTNILVGSVNNRPTAWIADFDFSGELRMHGTVPTCPTGAISHMPPEVMLSIRDSTHEEKQMMREKADIYALGLTIHEMLTGIIPFEGLTPNGIERIFYWAGKKSDLSIFEQHCPKEHENISGDLFALLRTCWSFDPNERPSMAELATEYRRIEAVRSKTSEGVESPSM